MDRHQDVKNIFFRISDLIESDEETKKWIEAFHKDEYTLLKLCKSVLISVYFCGGSLDDSDEYARNIIDYTLRNK